MSDPYLQKPAEAETQKSAEKKQPSTSPSAFSASGFSKLATSSSSPFASLGGPGISPFGSAGAPSLTSFASPPISSNNKPAEAPKLTFGGGGGASPFAGLASGTNGFGSTLGGGGFGSVTSGPMLGSFAAPGSRSLGSEKRAKPFGAPDSDVESDEDEDEGDNDSQQDEERAASPEKESEDKKKHKLQKGETTDNRNYAWACTYKSQLRLTMEKLARPPFCP